MAGHQATWTCSDVSLAAGEALIGSAPRADLWLLIEYDGAWEKKAFEASAIPGAVKQTLAALGESIPNTRIQLIRQGPHAGRQGIAFFVARTSGPEPSLYRFDLDAYEDIARLDLAAIAAGNDRPQGGARIGEPVFLVCTNGRRDACCARNGIPVYHALAELSPGAVWECTHLGAHRLGPNVTVLPSGVCYGRVTPADASAILDAGTVSLENLRGRSDFDPPAQAAELFLRRHTGIRADGVQSLAGVAPVGESLWAVDLSLGDARRSVRVERVAAGYRTYGSCGDEQPKDVLEFRLVDIA